MIRRPMKGVAIEETDFDRLLFPRYASPKIDGFRTVLGERPLTSRLSRFPNDYFDKELTGLLRDGVLLDSEAVVGRRRGPGVLQRTSSGLTSKDGLPDFTLWVFDLPGHSGYGWFDRYRIASQIIEDLAHPRIKLLRHRLIRDKNELSEYLSTALKLGFEGIMTRTADGPYKEGKATLREGHLLKVKPFDTCEGRIKGYFEEEANNNEAKREATGKLKRSSSKAGKSAKGTLGGFILDDLESGVEVRVGGGFTKQQREEWWPIRDSFIGAIARYSKQRVGEKDKPRHPNFVDLRPEWDMS